MILENSKQVEKKMEKKKVFHCPQCNKQVVVEENQPAQCPYCTNQPLKKLLNEKPNIGE